jgi:transcriptional regulator with XRE-family HTH domain
VLGQRLKELRMRRNWTQEYTALKIGLAADSIRRLEYGSFSPTLDTSLKVAKGFGLSVGVLLDDDFDEVDEVREYIRQLPEVELQVAIVVLRTLHEHASGEI